MYYDILLILFVEGVFADMRWCEGPTGKQLYLINKDDIFCPVSSLFFNNLESHYLPPRFKSYKNHLELVLRQFNDVKRSIPECLMTWFQPQVAMVDASFHPGLNILAWNCMNIGNDVWLH